MLSVMFVQNTTPVVCLKRQGATHFPSVFFLVLAALLLNGCALKQPGPVFDKSAFRTLPEKYRQMATEYEKKGQLREALLSWWVVDSFASHDPAAEKKINNLKKKVRQKSEDHFQRGESFYKQGALSDARRQFLVTLTYEPEHKEALDYLQNKLQNPLFHSYWVQEGDSLKSVARKTYADPGGESLIMAFNDLGRGDELTAGTRLKILILDDNFPNRAEFSSLPVADNTLQLEPRRQKKKVVAAVKAQAATDVAVVKAAKDKKDDFFKDAVKYRQARELLDKEEYYQALLVLRTIDRKFRDVKRLIASTEVFLQQEADAHYRKGISYFLAEKLEMAIREWEAVLLFNPNHLKAKKDLKNARRLLEKMNQY